MARATRAQLAAEVARLRAALAVCRAVDAFNVLRAHGLYGSPAYLEMQRRHEEATRIEGEP